MDNLEKDIKKFDAKCNHIRNTDVWHTIPHNKTYRDLHIESIEIMFKCLTTISDRDKELKLLKNLQAEDCEPCMQKYEKIIDDKDKLINNIETEIEKSPVVNAIMCKKCDTEIVKGFDYISKTVVKQIITKLKKDMKGVI